MFICETQNTQRSLFNKSIEPHNQLKKPNELGWRCDQCAGTLNKSKSILQIKNITRIKTIVVGIILRIIMACVLMVYIYIYVYIYMYIYYDI